jgi:hypothetical protein
MQTEKVLARHALPTGLTLEFWDLSKHTAGDRWQVVVEVRLAVPVTPGNLPPELQDKQDQVIAAVGSPVLFTKREVRNFIAAGELPELIDTIVDELVASLKGYLGHPQFAPRFLRKRFQEFLDRQKWYPEEESGVR